MRYLAALALALILVATLLARHKTNENPPEATNPFPPAQAEVEARTILVFGAEWCPYCFLLEEHLERADTRGFSIQKVDADKRPDLVAKYSVKVLPTSVILVGEKESSRITGFSKSDYEKWMESNRR